VKLLSQERPSGEHAATAIRLAASLDNGDAYLVRDYAPSSAVSGQVRCLDRLDLKRITMARNAVQFQKDTVLLVKRRKGHP
jgi:hypothetical protein